MKSNLAWYDSKIFSHKMNNCCANTDDALQNSITYWGRFYSLTGEVWMSVSRIFVKNFCWSRPEKKKKVFRILSLLKRRYRLTETRRLVILNPASSPKLRRKLSSPVFFSFLLTSSLWLRCNKLQADHWRLINGDALDRGISRKVYRYADGVDVMDWCCSVLRDVAW